MDYSILYIDDDADDHTFFQMALKRVGYKGSFMNAFNGQEALDKLGVTDPPPTLILVDLSMPVMDGFEFLKNRIGYESIPTYVFSTSSRDSDRENSRRLGASEFYTKPNTIQGITQMLQEILPKHIA